MLTIKLHRLILLFSIVLSCIFAQATQVTHAANTEKASLTDTKWQPELSGSTYSIRKLPPNVQIDKLYQLGYRSMWLGLGNGPNLDKLKTVFNHKHVVNGDFDISAIRFDINPKRPINNKKMEQLYQFLAQHNKPLWVWLRGKKADIESAKKMYKQVAMSAQRYGVDIVIYPHAATNIVNTNAAMDLIDALNLANLKLSIIWCHEIKTNDYIHIDKTLERVKSHLSIVALSGGDTKGIGNVNKWRHAIMPLSKGNIPVTKLTNGLKKMNYQNPVILKTYGIRATFNEHMPDSLNYWQKIIGNTL